MPSSPRLPCQRHNADGSKCANRTTRADGWCGYCKGFASPKASPRHVAPPRPQATGALPKHTWTKAPMPLSPEEAYEISVVTSAQENFVRHHGGTRKQAEAQIRSLLEDLLRNGHCRKSSQTGYYLLAFHAPQFGFYLRLGPTADAVVSYSTKHIERTYAQVKAGVKSRTRKTKTTTSRGWFRDKLENADLPARVTVQVIRFYASKIAGLPVNQETSDEILLALRIHLETHVVPQILAAPSSGERLVVDDGLGWSWIAADDEEEGGMAIIGMYETTFLKAGEESTPAAAAVSN